MAQVIQASELTLHDVEEKFHLQQVEDEPFFGEWQGKLPELTAAQKEWLDQVKADFLAIESKSKRFSLSEALPQALFYMLNSPNPLQPTFGLVTNGSHFMFIKLIQQDTPQYGLSDEFTLRRRGNELYGVLGVLKRLGELLTG